jgi:hypothetical protein
MFHREAVFYYVVRFTELWLLDYGDWLERMLSTFKGSCFDMGADRRASLKADDPLGKGIYDMGKLQGFLSFFLLLTISR